MKEWLTLKIELTKTSNLYDFHVLFCNNSDELKTIEFSNQRHNAEFQCLSFFDNERNMIIPKCILMINPIDWSRKYHDIQPGGYFEYVFKGKYQNDQLELITWAYSMQQNIEYCVNFHYMGIVSENLFFEIS